MLFHVRMNVNLPHDLPAAETADILAREKVYSQELQRSTRHPRTTAANPSAT
jgi:muconolactone D-isomerase